MPTGIFGQARKAFLVAVSPLRLPLEGTMVCIFQSKTCLFSEELKLGMGFLAYFALNCAIGSKPVGC